MRNSGIFVGILALALGLTLSWANRPSPASAAEPFEATVRLYSDGQVVGEWRAAGPGKLEGSTLVFPVEKGFRKVEVRIQGTFSYEVKE